MVTKKNIKKKKIYIILIITLLILIGIVSSIIFINKNKSNSNTKNSKLKLQKISNDIFEIKIPTGWKIETVGSYSSFGFRAINPNNEAYQIFFYLKMSPFNKSEESKTYFKNKLVGASGNYKTIYEIRSKSPVLKNLTAEAFYSKFNDYTIIAKEYGLKHNFNKFNNLKITKINGYSTNISSSMTTEGIVKIDFTNNSNIAATGIFAASIDANYKNIIGYADTAMIVVRNIIGMSAPSDEFSGLELELAESLASFKFTDEYLSKIKEQVEKDDESKISTLNLSTNINSINLAWKNYTNK